MNFGEARVRRYPVPCLQQHDVAGHELARWDARLRAISQDPDRGRQHLPERPEGVAGAVFLHEAQHGAEQYDHRDDDRVDDLAQERGQQRRYEQDDDERVLELGQEQRNRRGALFLGQFVRAERREALLRLLRGQASIEVCPEAADKLFDRLGVGMTVLHASSPAIPVAVTAFASRPRHALVKQVWAEIRTQEQLSYATQSVTKPNARRIP